MAEVCEYISRDSEHYAKLFAQRVFSAAEMLALFPESGRIVPEYDQHDLRELLFQNYLSCDLRLARPSFQTPYFLLSGLYSGLNVSDFTI